jgi:hypothetical protein
MPPRLASGRGLVWCPDWFQGTSLGSSLETASQTASQTPSQEVSGKQSGKLLQTASQTASQTPSQEVSGKLSGQLPRAVPRNLLQTAPGRSNHPIPRILGIGGLEGGPIGLGGLEGSIPYSIYISQFQTGTPKPRYIGFRDGGRETGTRNGQFRPVFGHILRPLPEPHFFMKFVLWSVSGAGSWEVAPGRLQDAFRTGVWEGCLEQLPRSCSRLLPRHPVWEGVWRGVWRGLGNSFRFAR